MGGVSRGRRRHLAIMLFNGGEDYAKQCMREGRVAATRILAVEKSEPFEPTAERLRGAVMAATRIQAAARRRIAIPGPTWWPRHSWPGA